MHDYLIVTSHFQPLCLAPAALAVLHTLGALTPGAIPFAFAGLGQCLLVKIPLLNIPQFARSCITETSIILPASGTFWWSLNLYPLSVFGWLYSLHWLAVPKLCILC